MRLYVECMKFEINNPNQRIISSKQFPALHQDEFCSQQLNNQATHHVKQPWSMKVDYIHINHTITIWLYHGCSCIYFLRFPVHALFASFRTRSWPAHEDDRFIPMGNWIPWRCSSSGVFHSYYIVCFRIVFMLLSNFALISHLAKHQKQKGRK